MTSLPFLSMFQVSRRSGSHLMPAGVNDLGVPTHSSVKAYKGKVEIPFCPIRVRAQRSCVRRLQRPCIFGPLEARMVQRVKPPATAVSQIGDIRFSLMSKSTPKLSKYQ